MLLVFWVLLLLAGAVLILLMPALWGKQIYNTYRAPRTVNCPETHSPVSVRFDALRAAITGLVGRPKLSLADCSRWPGRADCPQDCIPDAVKNTPAEEARVAPGQKRIAHAPVLIAAACAWLLGMAWHSQFLFRHQWTAALGLSDQQTLDLANRWTPHLLSVGACLLFAYGVAWVMNSLGKRSFLLGIRVAAALWFVLVAAVLVTLNQKIHYDLLWIEGIYTGCAALLIGAIAGGVPSRVFLKDSD